ncbi:radical SAM protein [candidate division FCPU426 bacterium]|nr:radical SAM protein [candidate division FCPU426 bacterium]
MPEIHYQELKCCRLCPRGCGVNRFEGNRGYCRSMAGLRIGAVCLHKGEEPVLAGNHGMCNVFFEHCNLQCSYCQNYQISRNHQEQADVLTDLDEVLGRIAACLHAGAACVGFVSPSHMIPHMTHIIHILRERGLHAVTVMNTNAYDHPGKIRQLAEDIDVYLPDLKYHDAALGKKFSGADDYPAVAQAALKEMYRQKGAELRMGPDGIAHNGLIIRHLVLPGYVDNTLACLRFIARELSPKVHVSVMAQYTPIGAVAADENLGRTITAAEYERVLEELDRLGMDCGWIQSLSSAYHYQPDFTRSEPF